jgi:hypothetical protein
MTEWVFGVVVLSPLSYVYWGRVSKHLIRPTTKLTYDLCRRYVARQCPLYMNKYAYHSWAALQSID